MKKEESEEKYIKWFSQLGKNDVKLVGGKAANLGEMYNLGMPVPPGFALTAEAYSYFLEQAGLGEKIYYMLDRVDIEETKELDEVSRKIKEMFENAKMPRELEKEIIESYDFLEGNDISNIDSNVLAILKTSKEGAFVAVRSSATAED